MKTEGMTPEEVERCALSIVVDTQPSDTDWEKVAMGLADYIISPRGTRVLPPREQAGEAIWNEFCPGIAPTVEDLEKYRKAGDAVLAIVPKSCPATAWAATREQIADCIGGGSCFTQEDRLSMADAILALKGPDGGELQTILLAYYWLAWGFPAQAQDVLRNAALAAKADIKEKWGYRYSEYPEAKP